MKLFLKVIMPSLTVMSLNKTSQQLHSLTLATNCLVSGRDCDSAGYHSVAQVEQQISKHMSVLPLCLHPN